MPDIADYTWVMKLHVPYINQWCGLTNIGYVTGAVTAFFVWCFLKSSHFSDVAHCCFSWVPCKAYDIFKENIKLWCTSNSKCFLCLHCVSFFFSSSSLFLCSYCSVGSQTLKAEESGYEEEMVARFGNLADVNTGLNGAAGPCGKVRSSMSALFPDADY